jgi:hypothetical protein
VLAGTVAAAAIFSFDATELGDHGELIGDGRIVVVEPTDEWIGQPLRLLKHIDIGQLLGTGDWTVIFVHQGCPKCEAVVSTLLQQEGGEKHSGLIRAAFVEVPSDELDDNAQLFDYGPFEVGQLTGQWEWFVATPLIVVIRDGTVVDWGKDSSVVLQHQDFRGNATEA